MFTILGCSGCHKKCLKIVPWTIVHQAPPSMGISRQEYWGGLPFPSLGDLPDQEIEHTSTASPPLASGVFTGSVTGKPIESVPTSKLSALLREPITKSSHMGSQRLNTKCRETVWRNVYLDLPLIV